MNSNHKTLFVINFKVVPFTKHVKNRKKLVSLFKDITLGKLDPFDMATAITDIEGDHTHPVIMYVHSTETTKDIKNIIKKINKLDDEGAIMMEGCDFDSVYKPPTLKEGSISIR